VSLVAIRVGNETDLPAVAAMWRLLDDYHRSLGLAFPHEDDAAEKWADSFRRTLGRFSFLWVAEQDAMPKAFLLARVKQSPAFLGGIQVGEISDLFVDESLRNSGVASQLVSEATKKFRELNIHSVEVQVQAGNQAGLDFWIKQDFKIDLTLVRKVL
jgi:ribosomal protein S18 acetylase RimI-like enzyme